MLMSYGMGDGGGGPTREMNENARELAEFPGPAEGQAGDRQGVLRAAGG